MRWVRSGRLGVSLGSCGLASQVTLNEERNGALNVQGNLGAPLSHVIRLLARTPFLQLLGCSTSQWDEVDQSLIFLALFSGDLPAASPILGRKKQCVFLLSFHIQLESTRPVREEEAPQPNTGCLKLVPTKKDYFIALSTHLSIHSTLRSFLK